MTKTIKIELSKYQEILSRLNVIREYNDLISKYYENPTQISKIREKIFRELYKLSKLL